MRARQTCSCGFRRGLACDLAVARGDCLAGRPCPCGLTSLVRCVSGCLEGREPEQAVREAPPEVEEPRDPWTSSGGVGPSVEGVKGGLEARVYGTLRLDGWVGHGCRRTPEAPHDP